MQPFAAIITNIAEENYRTKTFVLDATLDAYPGQFAMLWLPRFDEKPFSLVNANPVTFMVTAVGPFSRLLHEQQVGDRLWLRGPFGQGFQVPPTQKHLVLVGGGYGVAPLYWLAHQQLYQAERIDIVVGARGAGDLLYARHFEALITQSMADDATASVHLHQTTEDGTAGTMGRVTNVIEALLTTAEADGGPVDGIYACGPHPMLAALETMGQAAQIPCQLSWEAYMRCGIGICGACEYQGKVLCMDGPVLMS